MARRYLSGRRLIGVIAISLTFNFLTFSPALAEGWGRGGRFNGGVSTPTPTPDPTPTPTPATTPTPAPTPTPTPTPASTPTPTPTPGPAPTPTSTPAPTATPTPTSTPTPVAGLDQYGGVASVACPNGPKPHFYTQKIGNRWWLCDPAGHGFFMKGVTNIGASVNTQQKNLDLPVQACTGAGSPASCCTGVGTGTCGGKYYTGVINPYLVSTAQDPATVWIFNWIIEQINRLTSWGFNTVADDSYALMWPTMTDSRWNTSDHTIPAQFRMPFSIVMNTTAYSFSNLAGCGLTSPIKDMLNGLTLANQATAYYNYGDYFDPHYATCVNGQTNPANNSILQSAIQGPHNDYLLYITIDEGNQTGFNDMGPDFPKLDNAGVPGPIAPAAHAAWIAVNTAPTQSSNTAWFSGSYADREVYSKVKFADVVATEYAAPDCTGPGTPFAACTASATATNGSVDPSCTGSLLPQYCMSDTYIGSAEMGNALTRLNAAWGSKYTTLSTSNATCAGMLGACLQNGTYSSWGTGTGLLDENGSCPSAAGSACWVGDIKTLSGETTAMQADMTAYLRGYVDRYYGTLTNAFHTYEPGVLLQMIMGGWGTTPRKEVLQEASKYLDLPQLTVPQYCPTCTDVQQRIDFAAEYSGDKPWMTWEGFYANPDSSESSHIQYDNISTTQGGRGSTYQKMINLILNAKDSTTGTYHVVGFYWWDMFDENGEGLNWGLLSINDNPYDHCSATIAGCGLDQWGYSTGKELANYGDFISYVTSANNSVISNMAP